jgi:hypothetical protein
MVMIDGVADIVRANIQTARLFLYEPDALVGLPVDLLIPERYEHLDPRPTSSCRS